MEKEKRLIDANALLNEVLNHFGIDLAYLGKDLQFCQEAIEFAPTIEAFEVSDEKLKTAIKLLIQQYEHSKASAYVQDPIAHALYHTWKQVDERKDSNGKSIRI